MPRDRIIQTPVVAERGAIPTLPTLRRWGAFKRFESRMEHEYGRDVAEALLMSSYGVRGAFTPIAGFPAFLHDGCLVPRVSGGANGFADIADARAEALGGKAQVFRVDKLGSAATTGDSRQLWARGSVPVAGSNAAIAGGSGAGTNFDNTATGGLQQKNAWAGDTLFFVGANAWGTVGMALVMFDYFWGINLNMTLGTATITPPAPTKNQTAALSKGVWMGTRVTTGLGGTAVTYTFHYKDPAGATQVKSTVTMNATAVVHEPIDVASNIAWLSPTFSEGVMALVDWVFSGATATGNFDIMLGKNIVAIPILPNLLQGVAGMPPMTYIDGWMSAFNFAPIPASANLAFLEFSKSAGGQSGSCGIENLTLVAG